MAIRMVCAAYIKVFLINSNCWSNAPKEEERIEIPPSGKQQTC